MIISKIRAQNVLKYAELSIELAENGLIAISGPNESGKSSIGETLCFALFGRTFSITPQDIQKVVRWGENHCSVTLDFVVEDRRYVLSRFLDRDGNHSAKLSLVDRPEEPVARGVQPVADALFGILGFEFEEFVESFYLAQREITTPHPHSQAIKIMAGVAPLEQVVKALENEVAERRELVGEIKAEWDTVDQDVQALGIQEGYLSKLEDSRHETEQQHQEVERLIEEIEAGLTVCTDNTARVYRAESAKGRTSFLRFIVFVLAVAAGGLWALLTHGADLSQAELARELLTKHVPQWDESRTEWIGYLGAGLGVVFLLLWIRVSGLKREIAGLREESRQLGGVLARAREIELEEDEVELDEPEAAEGGVGLDVDEPVPVRPAREEFETLKRLLDDGEVTARLASEYCEHETGWLGYVAGRLGDQLLALDEEIEEEQGRLQEAMNLSEVLSGLTDKRDDVEARIDDRRRGIELLEGAIAHLSNTFNRDVKELVGRMLPLFTDNRYEHLQIDEGLKVRVFSNDKRDFMELEEVSSGTQRQIMLALRLALSKKLLSRTVKGRQFAFLDEPFAFFDQDRTRHALHALADLGDDISQVWIVAQGFPENCEVTFDTVINCERNRDTLQVGS